ncbi:MAG TPA: bacteriohopanetetrol glucosamine biosynthesis glycosyltransferase HpnI [Candidatus Rubrimentiphilum sp.]|nr:bacteriohopanetetrol glucosamine biosynthesis glycosyltransferase HpnI [Candidatus Rubrimentiphilum sp.]
MAFKLRDVAAATALALTAAGLAYSVAEIAGMRRFRRRSPPAPPASLPPITILKPLHGGEPQLYENLRSFCEQTYPQYQVIFGARDPLDPALDVARRLVQEFPERDLCVVASSGVRTPNPKIGNLLGMIGSAKHDVLVIADSDIRVGTEYLRAVASAFRDPCVGAATCLYGGVPLDGIAPQLGATIVNEHFMASVLVALMIEPLAYTFGATMAVRREALERIGGLAALGGFIGDDFMLGKLVSEAGYEIALCPYVVRMTVADPDVRTLWLHHLRWQRTVRASRPRGFAGSLVTYVLPLACISALLNRSPILAGATLAGAVTLRVIVHDEARKTFAPETHLAPWLIPAADALVFATWIAAFFGSDVTWRGDRYEIQDGGHLM